MVIGEREHVKARFDQRRGVTRLCAKAVTLLCPVACFGERAFEIAERDVCARDEVFDQRERIARPVTLNLPPDAAIEHDVADGHERHSLFTLRGRFPMRRRKSFTQRRKGAKKKDAKRKQD